MKRPVLTWAVYYDGNHVGDVEETTEIYARLAAYSQYEPLDQDGRGNWDMDRLIVAKKI